MNLRDLRYLVAVADHRHFGKAAAACAVSQPTLSAQLKKLEDYLGQPLFERTNKHVETTPIGRAVIARARNALAEVDAILEITRRGGGAPLTGPFRLGVIPTLGPYLLPWLVPALNAAAPMVVLVVHEDVTTALLDQLRHHRLDAALVALPIADEGGIATRPLFDEPFRFVCPASHPLAGATSVGAADLAADDLLLLNEGHCLRDHALALCRGSGREAPADFRASSLETLRQMVAAGMGSTLFPVLALEGRPVPGTVALPLDPAATRRIALAWRESYPVEADIDALAAVVRAAAPPAVTAVAGPNR